LNRVTVYHHKAVTVYTANDTDHAENILKFCTITYIWGVSEGIVNILGVSMNYPVRSC
jgi:hypothetical protein